ncbi:MAG TPA: DUF5655 domain-containing protein [Candidatus Limnocylindrales bacterium]|nr:DUF5655 domain-containing protein [Candidatus Limnocylindrales bacterium]
MKPRHEQNDAASRLGSRGADALAGDSRDAEGRESTRARSWQEMYVQIAEQLQRQTGADVASWNARIRERAPSNEAELRAWLGEQGVKGYPAMMLVFETFGYPDYLQRDANELIEAQYRDRPNLVPIYEKVVDAAVGLRAVELQARKTYVALVGPKRTFASIQATTRNRIDVGLRLDGVEPQGRLLPAKSIGQSSMTHKLALSSVDDVDAEAVGWLRRAYEANL